MNYFLRLQYTDKPATEQSFTDEQMAINAYDQSAALPDLLGRSLIKDETIQKLWQPNTRTWSKDGFFTHTIIY